MKALSIRQPWAWLIVNGFKDVENRTWDTAFRGRIYIHAGKVADYDASVNYSVTQSKILGMLPAESQIAFLRFRPWPLGAIVGEVTITGCVTESDSRWFEGPYGFILANPVAYETPIPYKGRLGFFDVETPTTPRGAQ